MKEENQRIASEKYLLDESEAKLKNSQHKEIHQSSKSINATHKLKLAIQKMKALHLAQIFGKKLMNLTLKRHPVEFQVKNEEELNSERIFHWEGFDVDDRLEAVILIMDVIMSLAIFVISGFQAYLEDFVDDQTSTSNTIVAIKIVAITIFVLKLFIDVVQVDVVDGKAYTYLTDIFILGLFNFKIIIDLIAIILMIITLSLPDNIAAGVAQFIFSLIKMVYLSQIVKIVEGYFINSKKKENFWSLIKVVVFNIFFAHFLGCLLLAVLQLDDTPDRSNNWLNKYSPQTVTWKDTYFFAYYWASTIMMTIGFGDITPSNQNQAFLVAFIEIFSAIVLAYNIGQIGSILMRIRSSGDIQAKKIGLIRRMSKKNKISNRLQKTMEGHILSQSRVSQEQEDLEQISLLNQLPKAIRYEFVIEANENIFQNFPFLKYIHKRPFYEIIDNFETKVYYGENTIFKAHNGSLKLSIIKSGQIKFCYWKPLSKINDAIVETHQASADKNLLINLNSMFRTDLINYNIFASTYSFALEIEIEKLISILEKSTVDWQFYHLLKDKHHFEANPFESIECEYCEQRHTKFLCPKLHYIPQKGIVIAKNEKSRIKNQRIFVKRRIEERIHCYYLRKEYKLKEKEYFFSEIQQEDEDCIDLVMLNLSNYEKEKELERNLNGGIASNYEVEKYLDETDKAENFQHYFPLFNSKILKHIQIKSKTVIKDLRKRREAIYGLKSKHSAENI